VNNLTISENNLTDSAQSVQDVVNQVQLIQGLMTKVMKPETHYGTIPGCGDKRALLKPGAEKICLIFRLSAQFNINCKELKNDHREYSVTCRLIGRDGVIYGEGIGVASTMESKYRYRSENTGNPVPSEYRDSRDSDLIGGPSFSTKKVDGKWMITHKVDHSDPADYYNTVAKMAKKRAHVDATITTTAAGDIFDQDTEDSDGIPPRDSGFNQTQQTRKPPQQNGSLKKATEKQVSLIRRRMNDASMDEAYLCEQMKIDCIENMPIGDVNRALEIIGQ